MILNIIFGIITDVIISIFSILPTLPDMPEVIITSVDWAIDLIVGTVSLFNQIYSPPLFVAIVTISFGLIAFENIYHTIMWILKKIPMLAIR